MFLKVWYQIYLKNRKLRFIIIISYDTQDIKNVHPLRFKILIEKFIFPVVTCFTKLLLKTMNLIPFNNLVDVLYIFILTHNF